MEGVLAPQQLDLVTHLEVLEADAAAVGAVRQHAASPKAYALELAHLRSGGAPRPARGGHALWACSRTALPLHEVERGEDACDHHHRDEGHGQH